MTEVVINACFGGFSLSAEAEVAYLARKGKQAFFYIPDRDSPGGYGKRDYVRVEAKDTHSVISHTVMTENIGDRVAPDVFWPGDGHPAYWYGGDLERDDPDLVAVVRELGAKASGRFASLSIVEIPDHVQWEIEEYDGLEHVAENHRTWS